MIIICVSGVKNYTKCE